MKAFHLMTAACAAIVITSMPAQAQQTEPIKVNHNIGRPENFDAIAPTRGISDLDRKTLVHANYVNIFEIKAGELAMRKGRSTWARHYGQDMVREHTMAQNELKTLARELRVSLPQTLPANMRANLRKLERASGSNFDTAYRNMMVKGHGEAEALMARQVKFGNDTRVINYATKMMGSIDHHEEMAVKRMTMFSNAQMYAIRRP